MFSLFFKKQYYLFEIESAVRQPLELTEQYTFFNFVLEFSVIAQFSNRKKTRPPRNNTEKWLTTFQSFVILQITLFNTRDGYTHSSLLVCFRRGLVGRYLDYGWLDYQFSCFSHFQSARRKSSVSSACCALSFI